MTKPNRKSTPRDLRGSQREPRPAWVRPFRRAHRAISASARLIGRTLLAVGASEQAVRRCPIRASRRIYAASGRLTDASACLHRAARDLARMNACVLRDPGSVPADAAQLLHDATRSWIFVTQWLQEVTGDVFERHARVLHGLATSELVPEEPAERRPRIVLAPRPTSLRAFLRRRQPRVVDRIASMLRRRRHTPRPAPVRVPRRSLLGRAPPLFSVCPL